VSGPQESNGDRWRAGSGMRRRRTILLVEDDSVDAMTVKRALDDAGGLSSLVHVTGAESALAYLRSDVNDRPYLILLDLNMPRVSGLEFLETIKADPSTRSIPVVVVTTSASHDDISESFKASVAGYITKPVDYAEFVAKIRATEQYWQMNRLPGDEWEAYDAGFRTHPVG
jgi:CheY-like chemotaxis protein